jgi:hypothetical protein
VFATAAAVLLSLAPAALAQVPRPLQAAQVEGPCADTTYPECRRLRFTYGPITVAPGNNAQYLARTIDKPSFDGYVTRIQADMVRVEDGRPPPTEELMLHHAVWVALPQYGNALPFYAVGEEKTAMAPPPGYGMPVRTTDHWALGHMLHNATNRTEQVLITYDLDYVPKAEAEAAGIKTVKPLWIDVRYRDSASYPVFNVQRGRGKVNRRTGRRECAYPRQRCAAFDPWGVRQPGNRKGYDLELPNRLTGTLVAMGGHLHPGGLRDEISIVRKRRGRTRVRRIFNSQAVYYDPGGPLSWDMAMTVTPENWRVRIRPGDRIRLNAVYESQRASWYEGMGIVMAFVAPGDRSGVDPFRKGARIPLRGRVTHGHLPENDNRGGRLARPLPAKRGPVVSRIAIRDFVYKPGDLSNVGTEGVPRVRSSRPLTFRNLDSPSNIWHTITTCKPPCTATTGISYPLADSLPALDSLELGFGSPPRFQPTAQRDTYRLTPRRAGLKAGRAYTYFCRIHPSMRGAFRVVK